MGNQGSACFFGELLLGCLWALKLSHPWLRSCWSPQKSPGLMQGHSMC